MKQKSICMARVIKNIAYFIVPIFIIALIITVVLVLYYYRDFIFNIWVGDVCVFRN